MNKNAPIEIKFLIILYIAIALSIPAQIIWLYDISPWDLKRLYYFLPANNLLLIMASVYMASQIIEFGPKVKYLLGGYFIILFTNNYLVSSLAQDFSFTQTLTASLFVVGVHSVLLKKELFLCLVAKKKRWWRTKKRHFATLPVKIYSPQTPAFATSTVDISENGIFVAGDNLIALDASYKALNRKPILRVQQKVRVKLQVDKLISLQCEAQVIRSESSGQGKYPQGYGLEFLNLTRAQKRKIKISLSQSSGL